MFFPFMLVWVDACAWFSQVVVSNLPFTSHGGVLQFAVRCGRSLMQRYRTATHGFPFASVGCSAEKNSWLTKRFVAF